jgi:hypothetical protein
MAAAAGPDPELARAFTGLQQKMAETQAGMRFADFQINQKQVSIKRSQLTAKELEGLPGDVRVFKSVGRM